ncbi:BA75_04430T0 [Komagataella pastoris]|uniref:ASTRA-associated protein 1 n=1 Tax=Komagataella pastoris TaxID=4922 RepID=A0A1B2JH19_PICPA|nr:BA75_04430T0 [Komagataella pastoris]
MHPHTSHGIESGAMLRFHKSPVSALEPFYLPSPFVVNGEPLLLASLVSADENGWVVWWDLGTKRPLGIWRAHESTIVTVQQMGIHWDGDVPRLHQNSFGKLLTHGRDNCLRIWDLFRVSSFDSMDWNLCKVLHKTRDTARNPDVYEIPVNALNFCNVAARSEMIATPASLSSENFDIYIVSNDRLDRLHSNVDTCEILQQNQDSHETDESRKFGAIMQIIWTGNLQLVVGYESGIVACIQLQKNFIQVVWVNDSHLKYPILGMASTLNRVFTCSASDRIVVNNLKTGKTVAISKIKHKGISSLDVTINNNIWLVSVTTWDGFSRIYSYDEDSQAAVNGVLKPSIKLRRVPPKVVPSVKRSSAHQKIELPDLRGRIVKLSKSQNGCNNALVERSDGQSKMILRSSERRVLTRYAFVGYQDGRVATYILSDS